MSILFGSWNTKAYSPFSKDCNLPWFHNTDTIKGDNVAVLSTQYELCFAEKGFCWPSPNLEKLDGTIENKSNPFSSNIPWEWAGKRFIKDLNIDAKSILFVCNNEYPKLRWNDISNYKNMPTGDENTIRKFLSEAYFEKTTAMLKPIREKFPGCTIIGYNAFSPSFLGRWQDWTRYSYHFNSTWNNWAWDGPSLPYYTSDWDGITDCNVWSVQVEAMNWAWMLQQNRPKWVELSVWDGNTPGKPSKKDAYIAAGQTWSPERYVGSTLFGIWLIRPDSVREFRPHTEDLTQQDYFFALKEAIAKLDKYPYKDFYERGKLIPGNRLHPYQTNIPDSAKQGRWFMLNNSSLPAKFSLLTQIPVFSLGLELDGFTLIYAHAPLGERTVKIDVGKDVEVTVPTGGCHVLLNKSKEIIFYDR